MSDVCECLRCTDVAQKLGISARRVQKLLRLGLLPGTRLGRTWVIPRPAFEQYLGKLSARAEANFKEVG